MINIIIKETGKQETLELIDRKTGSDWASGLIGQYDGFGTAEHQFAEDEESGSYVCTQSTFDWWEKVLADQDALADRIAELSEEHGSDAVYEAIGNAGDCDLEDQAAAIHAALDEAFPVTAGN